MKVRTIKSMMVFAALAIMALMVRIPALADAAVLADTPFVAAQKVYLPLVNHVTPMAFLGEIRAYGGSCPVGYHLVDASGAPLSLDSDTKLYSDETAWCAPDENLDGLACSVHGSPRLIDGQALCACAEGYTGEDCSACAAGYEAGAGGECVALPVTDITITGGELSLEFGESALLQASSPTGGSYDFSLGAGSAGCLKANLGYACQTQIAGVSQVYYVAPAAGSELNFAQVTVAKNGAGSIPAQKSLVYAPPGSVKIYGNGDPDLAAFVRIVEDHMRRYCIGAGTLGIAKDGKVVGMWGFGRTNGRPVPAPMACMLQGGAYDPAAQQVTPLTPFRLGSMSKGINYAIARIELKKQWKAVYGSEPTDDQIEALRLLDDQTLNMKLLPDRLFDILSRNLPLPNVHPPSAGSGLEPLDGYADPRWQDVTLGQLIAHRAGQRRDPQNGSARGGSPLVAVLYKPEMRNLASPADFQAQQAILEAQYGAPAVSAARAQIAALTGQPASAIYIIPQPNVEESLINAAGSVLVNEPGEKFLYSNIDPMFLTLVAERVSGKPFSVDNGETAGYMDTLLYRFAQDALDITPADATSSLYRSHFVTPAQAATLLKEPVTRQWSPTQNTWYPVEWDAKRPFCIWNGGECAFSSWLNHPSYRPNWGFEVAQMPRIDARDRIWVGSGLIAADTPTMLRYLDRYWAGGYGSDSGNNPRIGESRRQKGYKVDNLFTEHNGAYDGIYAHGIQFGPFGPKEFQLPVLTPDGKLPIGASTSFDHQFVVTELNGKVTSFGSDGFPLSAFSEAPESITLGRYDLSGLERIYIATSAWGMLKIYDRYGVKLDEFPIGFDESDRIQAINMDNDVFDEIVLSKPNNGGEVQVYDHDGSFLKVITNALQAGDQVLFGGSNPSVKMYLLRQNGQLWVFDLTGSEPAYSIPLDYLPGDGFAVGDVAGDARGEVLVAHQNTGKIDIYVEKPKYTKWQTFNGYFEVNGMITVSDLGTSRGFILVGQPSSGKVRVFQAREKQQWTFDQVADLQTLGNYKAGGLLATGRLSSGQFMYQCSNKDGQLKSLPAGVELFVAFNQDDGSSIIANLMKLAACQTDWNQVKP